MLIRCLYLTLTEQPNVYRPHPCLPDPTLNFHLNHPTPREAQGEPREWDAQAR